jgi:hypothetical protein
MKLLLVLISVVYLSGSLFAQPGSGIRFLQDTHDFGQVKGGSKSRFTYKFVNVNNQPVSLKTVKGSCACTLPMWSEAPIAPGDTGEIIVEFRPKKDKAGPFTKSVLIQTNTGIGTEMVFLKGEVIPQNPSSAYLNPTYYYRQGYLVFEMPTLNISVLKSNEQKSAWIRLQNTWKKPVSISFSPDNTNILKVDFTGSKVIAPGKIDSFQIIVDGTLIKKSADGFFSDTLRLVSNDPAETAQKLPLIGSWQRVYTPEELESAPKIKFEQADFEAGKVVQGDKLNHSFKFTNTGKSNLLILSAKPSCGCTASAPEDTEIKPGESSQINITFDSNGRNGAQVKSVTVTSNDPVTPTAILTFKCEVVVDPFRQGNGPVSK